MRLRWATTILVALAVPPAAQATPTLRAGAGRADMTPPQTGYFLGGWTRADRLGRGVSTRLFANTIVLERGGHKLALVAVSLFAVTAGLQDDVAHEVADLGYTRQNVLLAATHTHSAPGGWANNPDLNTAAPSVNTIGDPASFVRLLSPAPANRLLYTFLVERIAQSIRRADADLGPARAGWGHASLVGATQNRSLEAHLANFGIQVPLGAGTPSQAPGGYPETIDPNVDVLRVDKLVRRRGRCRRRSCRRTVDVPIGAWSNFANHGTVVKSDVELYSEDHHGAADRVFVDMVRRAGHVPAAQTVVNVYPNSNEGDMTAGLAHTGIDGAELVGREEAASMFAAWRSARLSRTPAVDLRWTVSCFCDRPTSTGTVTAVGRIGAPFLTGSEEGRGPLFDLTGVPFEGLRSPVADPKQGDKVALPIGNFPPAVPLTVIRIGDGVIGSVPGEPTKQVGLHIKEALVAAMRPVGVTHAVVAGLADDYINYVTTPAEYDWQAYEGGSTLYGRNEAAFFQDRLVELGNDMATGRPAPDAYPFDPGYDVHPIAARYPDGGPSGQLTAQPSASYRRPDDVRIAWHGSPSGHDMPVDAAFISVQRHSRTGWSTVDSDLGLNTTWRTTDAGQYEAIWSAPRNVQPGTYRLVVTAQHYQLVSASFDVAG